MLENLLSDLSKEELSTKSEKELLNIVDYISRVLKEILLFLLKRKYKKKFYIANFSTIGIIKLLHSIFLST